MAQNQLGQNSMQGLAARQVPDLCEMMKGVLAASQLWETDESVSSLLTFVKLMKEC